VPGHGLLDTVILFLYIRHVEVPGHALLDTVILFLSFRHVEGLINHDLAPQHV
jgi:uncharacterized protein YceK